VCKAEFDLCGAVIHMSLYFFFTTERTLSRYKGHTKRQGKDNVGFQMQVMRNKWKMGLTVGTHFPLLQSGATRQRNTLHWTSCIATFCIRISKKVTNFKTRYSCLAWGHLTELGQSSFCAYIFCPLDPCWWRDLVLKCEIWVKIKLGNKTRFFNFLHRRT